MAQIKVPDELHARLKSEADKNYRSIGGHIEFLLDNASDNTGENTVEKKSDAPHQESQEITPTPEKIQPPKPRGASVILREINELEREMKESVNQDPDWWADMNVKKDNLWAEFHALGE